MSLELLGDNLRELYISVHDQKVKQPELIPNLQGTRVYHAASGFGRVWKWLFNVIGLFIGNNLKLKKLKTALLKTKQTFEKQLPTLRKHLKTYQDYLEKYALGFPVDEKLYHKAREGISKWSKMTIPFLETAKSKKNEKTNKIFESYFPATQESTEPPFHCAKEMDLVKTLQPLIDLEGILHEPLPLSILKKLSAGTALRKAEKLNIESWINKLLEMRPTIEIGPLHKGLLALVRYFSSAPNTPFCSVARLEMALDSLGLNIFHQSDPEHLKWRGKLKRGMALFCNGRTIVLGNQIQKRDTGIKNKLIFELEDEPSAVFITGKNCAILSLREIIIQEDFWGIPSTKCIEIDSSGRFGIYERLSDCLTDTNWDKEVKPLVFMKDRKVIDKIAETLKWMISQNRTPISLDAKHVMFSKEGDIRYTKICFPEVQFNFYTIERFIYESSKENPTIHTYFISQTCLTDHPCRKFYEKMMVFALNDKEVDAKEVAAEHGIYDAQVIDRGKALFKDVIKLKDRVLSQILISYNIESEEKLKSQISKELRGIYKRCKLCSHLFSHTEQKVIDNVTFSMSQQLRQECRVAQ